MGPKARTIKFYSGVSDRMEVVHLISKLFSDDGGKGSGNFGHAGRPGKVGGSAKGSGGSMFRSGSKETGYTSFVKTKLFAGIASHARAAKNDGDFIHGMNKAQKDALRNQWRGCGTSESLGKYAERIYNMLHSRKGSEIRQKNNPVDGKDLSDTWRYEEKHKSWESAGTAEIDTEIETILHAQGYDGVPKVVSRTEFDRLSKENPQMPILYRSYAAPDPETLEQYDKDLEGGFFYVDCSEGGAGFGQGMYCAGVYPYGSSLDTTETTEEVAKARKQILTKGAIEEMKHYRSISLRRIADTDPHVAPEGKVMVTGGTNDDPLYKYYDPNEFRDFSSQKPEEGQMIAYWDSEAKIAGEGIVTYKDGQIDGMYIKWDPAPGDKWAPLEGDCEKVELNPQATTRMMTLDPSAKIVTYEQLGELRNELVDKRQRERSEFLARQKEEFVDKLADEITRANGITGERKEKYKDMFYLYAFGNEDDDELLLSIEKELGEVEGRGLIGIFGRKWNDFEPQRPEYRPVPSDRGVLAAMLGYDAINAVGHGESKSYTVVLNRTKLIVCEDSVDVEG